MRTLYQKAAQAKELKINQHLTRVSVDLDDELDLQCSHCLTVLVPLHSVDYYMRVLKNEDKLGNDFLVMRRMIYHQLAISKDIILCQKEPFECIYLKQVTCRKCSNSLGILFTTANANGTAWLLDRIAFNMEEVVIMSSQRNLLETLKQQLQKLPPERQTEVSEIFKEIYLADEGILATLLKNAVDPTYHQNKMKNQMVEDFLASFSQYDSHVSNLDMRSSLILKRAEENMDIYNRLLPQLKKQAREKDIMRKR